MFLINRDWPESGPVGKKTGPRWDPACFGYLRTCCTRMKENRSSPKKKDFCLLSIKSNALNRSNNIYCSCSAHLFLSYPLVYVSWYKLEGGGGKASVAGPLFFSASLSKHSIG